MEGRRRERRCRGRKEAEWREKERRRGLTARETNVREKKGGHEGGKRLERWSRTEGESNDLSFPSVSEITPTLPQPNRLMCDGASGKKAREQW